MLIANHGPSQSPNPSASEFATAVSSRQVRRRSSGSVHTSGQSSVVNSVKASTPYLSSNTYSVLTATHNFLDPSQTLPRVTPDSAPDLVKPAHTGHKYWCTVCDNHSFEHSDGWKKHEKEHEIKYVCMLEELFEPTKEGGGCNLCGALNQPDNHHLIHNIASCINAARRPCFKRRYDMERHLKDVHAIKEKVLRRNLADKCRCKSSKSAWSCGFCVHLSASHQEHLKHIGTAHFEKGQSLKDWNYNNIIQGLLLQSGISEAWINLLDSLDPYRFSEIKWNKAGGENLLHKLERGLTGNETPQTLAKAAYDSAEFDWSLIDTYITTSATATDMILNQDVGKSLSPSFQDHTSKSEEALVKCQPWSPPPHQAAQIPTSSPNSEVQYAYGTAALRSSPARPLHAFSQSPGWDTLTSDTGDVNSTPRSRYDITPDAAHSDQGTFRYNNNHTIDWPIHHQSDAHNQKIGSTLKRSRDSPSPPYYSFARGDWLTDDPRKKGYLKKGG